MTMFDARSEHRYCANLRRFLKMSFDEFLDAAGLPPQTRSGKPLRYPRAAVQCLEALVNAKAAECESTKTSVARRLRIAMDYQHMSDAVLGRALGVSRAAVSLWVSGKNEPAAHRVDLMAQVLDVPVDWLILGDAECLPADSHIGVRVGTEAKLWRLELREITKDLVGGLSDEDAFNEFVEQLCADSYPFRSASRRAGGRWLATEGDLVFAQWHPLVPEKLQRRYWPDPVEAKLEDLSGQDGATTIAVWRQLKAWCDQQGYQCPKPITLYQRARKLREHSKRFGYLPRIEVY